MALRFPLLLPTCSTKCPKQPLHPKTTILTLKPRIPRSYKASSTPDDTVPTPAERAEWRQTIRDVINTTLDIQEETDPTLKKTKLQKLLADYPLVVEEEDPDWPEEAADGWGFNFDQFFNKISIKNVKKDVAECDNEGDEEEVVWQDDDYIRPVRDVTAREWEETVFTDFNPLVILVHHRYRRPGENDRARVELERAVQMFWDAGLPSPRCVAVDAVVEDDIVSALRVSSFPEILFTKAGKILHRDSVVRGADEWSKIMAFFYYKAVRPSCLDEGAGQNEEKIPTLIHREGNSIKGREGEEMKPSSSKQASSFHHQRGSSSYSSSRFLSSFQVPPTFKERVRVRRYLVEKEARVYLIVTMSASC